MFDASALKGGERASARLRALYRRRGYCLYRMSRFEEYELYARNRRFLVSRDILSFTDKDGRLMALKPDVTLSIIKNAPDAGEGLQKVYYHENVYRTSPAAVGYREIMQTGLECIGQVGLLEEGEVLSLAAESLEAIGRAYLLDVSHLGFAAGLTERLAEAVRRDILAELGRKNVPALRELCARNGVEHALSEKLCELAGLYGGAELFPRLEELAEDGASRAALAELRTLWGMMESLGLAENLRLDFSIVNDMSYYNGLIFRGYLPGLASGVLAGGRYDNLLRKMGRQGGAVGFAVYLDQLERLEETGSGWDGDILLQKEPENWGGTDGPSGRTGASRRGCASGRRSGLRKGARRDGACEYRPAQGPAGGEGLPAAQGRRVPLSLH